MADLDRTIRILFQGEDQLSGVSSKISGNLTGLVSAAQSIAEPLAQAGTNVLKLDAALAALATTGLAYAFQKSKEFESAYVDLDKVLGDNESIDIAKERAKQLADTYGESVNTMLASMATFRQAGFKLDDAMGLTKSALDLMIAGDISLGMATEDLTAILKGFKSEAGEAGRVVDILNEVSNNYAASTKELARGMAGISPIAKTMGFSFEETAGLLTPVIEVFRSGDEAAIALKTGLLSLQEPSKSTGDALKALGVAQRDSNGNMKDGRTLFYEVAQAFGSLTDAQKTYVAQLLFGKEQAARMMEVFNGLPTVLKVTNTAMGATGSAAKEVAKRLETAEIAVKQFKSAFEQLAIEIGNNFRGSAVQVVKGATEIEQSLRAAIVGGSFKVIFDALNDFDAQFSAFLRGIAKALPEALSGSDFQAALRRMVDALKALGNEFGGLFGDLDLTKPKDLERALVAVADTITSVVKVTQGMVEAFDKYAWPVIKQGIKEFNSLDDSQKLSIGRVLEMAMQFTSSLGSVVAVLAGVGDAGQNLHATMQTVFGGIEIAWNSLMGVLDLAAATLFKTVESFMAPIVAALNEVGITKFNSLFQGIQTATNALLQAANDDADGVARGMKRIADAMDGASTATSKVKQAVDEMPKEASVEFTTDAAGAEAMIREFVEISGKSLAELKDQPAVVAVRTEDAQAEIDGLKVAAVDKLGSGIFIKPEVKFDQASSELDKSAYKIAQTGEALTLVFRQTSDAAKDTKKKIEELPAEKKLKLELENKIDLEKIKTQAALVEKVLDFRAKIEIADMEAQTERIKALANSISDTFKSAGDVVSNLFGDLKGFSQLGEGDKRGIFEIAGKQMEMQREAQKMQKELVDAQVKYLTKKAEMFGQEVPIKIETAGVEPEIEAFMWKILTKIRIRAAADEAEFLLGLKGTK